MTPGDDAGPRRSLNVNRMSKTCLIAILALAAAGCATTPPPAPQPVVQQQPEPEPVNLLKPALLERIPVFAPPPSPVVDSYYNDAFRLPLDEYINLVKQQDGKRLPYRR